MEEASCLFCKILKKEIPSKAVYEDNEIYAFNDINPQAPTHVLIIPKLHIPRLLDLNQETSSLIGKLSLVANQIAKERKITEGYRVVINCNRGAGQAVYHIHMHLLGGRPLHWPPG